MEPERVVPVVRGARGGPRGRRIASALLLALLSVACSRTGDLSGDIVVTKKSGDAKRGAETQVTLVRATDPFEANLKKTEEEFKKEYETADAPYQQAKKNYAAGVGNPFSVELARISVLSGRHDVIQRYVRAQQKMIGEAQPRVVGTDVNGHYSFKDVPAGRYRVFATFHTGGDDFRWSVATDVKGGSNRVDLSNSNIGWPRPEN